MPFQFPGYIAPGRCIVFLICLTLTVMLLTSKSEVEPLTHHDVQLIPRQNSISPPIPSSTPVSVPVPVSPTPTSATTSPESSPSQPSAPPNETPSSTPTTSQSPSTLEQEPSSTTPPPRTSATPPPQQLSSIQSTGSDGSPTVVVVTVLASNSGTSTSPTATSTSKEENAGDSSGLGTGSIVGLSVAGGIAFLGIVAFFIWKFTQKRRSAAYDDGEIKWPDLNSENHVSGQDDPTGPQSLSDGASLRDPSFRGAYGDGGLGASQSQVDLYAADPYAVPPLPHLNPNQPYRDDPADPYHDNFGAPAFHESRPTSPSIRGEAIPMNQINRSRSPGPQAALHTGYGGRQSPGPQDAYGGGTGRQSPGPHDAYGGGIGRQQSPGPQDAYGGGIGRQQSPGPQDAYGGGYGRRSPGPNDAYGPR